MHGHAVQILVPVEDVGGGAPGDHEVHELLGAVAVRAEEGAGREAGGVHVGLDGVGPACGEHAGVGEGDDSRAVGSLEQGQAVAHALLEGARTFKLEHGRLRAHFAGRGERHAPREEHEGRTGRGDPAVPRGALRDAPERPGEGLRESRVPLFPGHHERVQRRAVFVQLADQEGLDRGDDAARAAPVLAQAKGQSRHVAEAEALAHPRSHPLSARPAVEELAEGVGGRVAERARPDARAHGPGGHRRSGPPQAGGSKVPVAHVHVLDVLLHEQGAVE
mmetsp:Transcript_17157/g.49773  ORF Transcript_17157/g.49773 Transcript_17157/m.49773 type:complete len:277 (-) Transcript_17157:567-1397(-)